MIPRPPDLNVGSRARALQVLTCDPSLQHLPTRVNIETGGYRGGTLPLLKIGQDFFRQRLLLAVDYVTLCITYRFRKAGIADAQGRKCKVSPSL